ncbi:MAG: 4Fe-4S binding protein [Candidatus Bathyarchaeota archaeon]|nr:4Fe-4S binding protein [Candidatus Bathyarchaeota archaeon]
MAKVVVNHAKCVKEQELLCVDLCPVSVFQVKKNTKALVVHEEKCIMCRTCQVNCPGQAIEIIG